MDAVLALKLLLLFLAVILFGWWKEHSISKMPKAKQKRAEYNFMEEYITRK